ncbi:hypothetical protein FlaCF_1977 [Flavobacterium tructae]
MKENLKNYDCIFKEKAVQLSYDSPSPVSNRKLPFVCFTQTAYVLFYDF